MPSTDLFASLDAYCERVDASFWSEPLNAVSNGAFLVAAACGFWLWRRAGGRDAAALWLILVTACVGIGSFLFHTLANRWSLYADIVPIGVFIYSYFLVAMRRLVGLSGPAALAATTAFVAVNLSFERVWIGLVGPVTLNGSVGYLPAALALVAVGALVRRMGLRDAARGGAGPAEARRRLRASRALLTAGAVFSLSLVFRTVDEAACRSLPVGTHHLWHLLNAAVLFLLTHVAITQGPPARR
jgi:Ceramidase